MPNTTLHLPLNEITVLPQPRRVFRDISALADDIREHGLLQPPTITPSKRLLMGERRFRACKLLGLESIDFNVHEKDLTDDEILEIQVAENVARDDLVWQERALAMLEIYERKRLRGALEGWSWGQREASALFKIAVGTVNYVLIVADRLRKELSLPEDKRKYWNFNSASDAYRSGILAEEEDKWNSELAKQTQTSVNQGAIDELEGMVQSLGDIAPQDPQAAVPTPSPVDLTAERDRYNSNPLNTQPFDEYWNERQAELAARRTKTNNVLHLSSRIVHADCIDYMMSREAMFDHIITDIPFAIDVNNLDQNTTGIVGIDRTADAHQVAENLDLHSKFFRAAFFCTKDKSYVITFCDMMEFRRMVDLAEEAGFSAQRWPLIWPKTIAMNSCAHCNSTKNYEVALICHKPGATFVNKMSSSILPLAGGADAKKITGHPFAKPFEVTHVLCDAVSIPGQRILEPFAGGGSMVLEMLKMEREVFAVEKYEHQYNSLLENVKREHYLKINSNYTFK